MRRLRKGSRHVVLRHGGREAHLREDGSFWITFSSATIATTMASTFDDRRDAFTVRNLAHRLLAISTRGSREHNIQSQIVRTMPMYLRPSWVTVCLGTSTKP
jgi:hypothetical protein